MKNKCEITVGGVALTLYSEYDRDYVDTLAADASERLDKIFKGSRFSSKLDAALLTVLDLLDENKKLAKENAELLRALESMKLDLEIATIEKENLKKKPNT